MPKVVVVGYDQEQTNEQKSGRGLERWRIRNCDHAADSGHPGSRCRLQPAGGVARDDTPAHLCLYDQLRRDRGVLASSSSIVAVDWEAEWLYDLAQPDLPTGSQLHAVSNRAPGPLPNAANPDCYLWDQPDCGECTRHRAGAVSA